MPGTRLFCNFVAIVTAISLVLVCRTNTFASQPQGFITVDGAATINNSPAISGQTIFDDTTIATTNSASLTLDVPRSTRIQVAEETELNVKVLSPSLEAILKSGRLTCSTLPGAATRVEIIPGLSVLSDASLASQFTVEQKDGNFEVSVSTGAVDVLDTRASTNAAVTHVGPGATFSNAGLTQTNQSNLSNRQRAALFLAAGGALALIFLIVVNGNDAALDGPGGCVIVSGERGC